MNFLSAKVRQTRLILWTDWSGGSEALRDPLQDLLSCPYIKEDVIIFSINFDPWIVLRRRCFHNNKMISKTVSRYVPLVFILHTHSRYRLGFDLFLYNIQLFLIVIIGIKLLI